MGVAWGEGGVIVFSHFMLFPTFIEKYLGIQNNYFSFNVFFVFFLYAGAGGGGGWNFCFCRKTILSHFTFYAIFNIKQILKSAPSLTG